MDPFRASLSRLDPVFSKERRSMMGSMFDGMEIVVDVILGVRSRTELDPPEG